MRAFCLVSLCALAIGALPVQAAPEAAADQACASVLEFHAMLTRAKMQCGFGRYNQALIDRAAVCARGRSETDLQATVVKGAGAFDASAAASGKPGTCAALLRQFPQFVRR